jgi:hypothetical protein
MGCGFRRRCLLENYSFTLTITIALKYRPFTGSDLISPSSLAFPLQRLYSGTAILAGASLLLVLLLSLVGSELRRMWTDLGSELPSNLNCSVTIYTLLSSSSRTTDRTPCLRVLFPMSARIFVSQSVSYLGITSSWLAVDAGCHRNVLTMRYLRNDTSLCSEFTCHSILTHLITPGSADRRAPGIQQRLKRHADNLASFMASSRMLEASF